MALHSLEGVAVMLPAVPLLPMTPYVPLVPIPTALTTWMPLWFRLKPSGSR